ncbi:MAG: HAD family hydrolase [Alphaproteobacteria bacterium]|nr:HAD family hydrolase [Alphaproteobacteria bacterium]
MTYLAVFDWNCTLIDDFVANLAGANAALNVLGHEPITAERYREAFTFPILHSYVALGIKTDDVLSCHEELASAFLDAHDRETEKAGLRPGARELLQDMNDRGVHCLLLTNHFHDHVRVQLERFSLLSLFQGISCNREYDASYISAMNKQERLQAYMDEHGFTPDHAFIIGDTNEEAKIGRHLWLTTFSITGGLLSEERLKALAPDHIVSRLSEVLPILEKTWNFQP